MTKAQETVLVFGDVLDFIGEPQSAQIMDLLFETFKENYLLGKERKQLPENATQYRLIERLKKQ